MAALLGKRAKEKLHVSEMPPKAAAVAAAAAGTKNDALSQKEQATFRQVLVSKTPIALGLCFGAPR